MPRKRTPKAEAKHGQDTGDAGAAQATPPAVELVPLDSISPDPANVRRRGPEAKAAIKASLGRFGAGRSIVVDRDGVVRAGNGTLEAAKDAGFTEVLVVDAKPGQLVAVRRDDWTAAEAQAYGIADNRTAELAEWDDLGLARQLQALRGEEDPLVAAAAGYTEAEVDAMLERLGSDLLEAEGLSDPTAGAGDGGLPVLGDGHQPASLAFLSFAKEKVPMDEAEADDMAAALNEFVGEHGTTYGFARWLLTGVGIGAGAATPAE